MPDSDVTFLLRALEEGDRDAAERLAATVHDELRAMARASMRHERAGHTLQPTALVNEAYMRLVVGEQRWQHRAHFFGAAAQAMRRILVDHARARLAEKRGGGAARVTFDDIHVEAVDRDTDLLALDDALTALERHDERLANIVRLRHFVGLTVDQIAETLERSASSVKRDWTYARAWLWEHIGGADGEGA